MTAANAGIIAMLGLVAVVTTRADTPAERLVEPLVTGARRLAERLGRTIEVVVATNDVRIDAERTMPLWSALSHVVRNAIDHGIEPPDARVTLGKPAAGRVDIEVSRQPGSWSIAVADDGAGIDWDGLAARATELGWPHGDREGLTALLFCDGVSTRDQVTESSGRGVGLAALRAAADQLGAEVAISSERGWGTRLTVTVPDGGPRARSAEPQDAWRRNSIALRERWDVQQRDPREP